MTVFKAMQKRHFKNNNNEPPYRFIALNYKPFLNEALSYRSSKHDEYIEKHQITSLENFKILSDPEIVIQLVLYGFDGVEDKEGSFDNIGNIFKHSNFKIAQHFGLGRDYHKYRKVPLVLTKLIEELGGETRWSGVSRYYIDQDKECVYYISHGDPINGFKDICVTEIDKIINFPESDLKSLVTFFER